MLKSPDERIQGWLKNGFTAKALPFAYDKLTLYFSEDIRVSELRAFFQMFCGEDRFCPEGSNIDEFIDVINYRGNQAVTLNFSINNSSSDLDLFFDDLVENPIVLGIVAHQASHNHVVLHQKAGFKCPEMQYDYKVKDRVTTFGSTKVMAPNVLARRNND